MRNRDMPAGMGDHAVKMPLTSAISMAQSPGLTKFETAAIAAMQGILACPEGWAAATAVVKATDARISTEMAVAHFSISHAKALFDELEKPDE